MGLPGGDRKAAHVLAMPAHGQGHVTPLLRISTQLARKGITVSFVCYEDSIPSLSTASVANDESSNLDSFRFITLHRPRQEVPGGRLFQSIDIYREAFEPLRKKLLRDKSAGISGGPTCIISDMFFSFSLDVAMELQIPRYALVASGANFVRLMQGSIEYFERGQFEVSESDGKLMEFDWPVIISGLSPVHYHELNALLRIQPAIFRVMAESVMKSAGVLVNSFLELEEKVIEVCRSLGHPTDEHTKVLKIYPIGPLFSTNVLTNPPSVHKGLEDSSSKCLLWLGSQSASSVLYVAFGSATRLRPEQITELAHGLEASNQPFLWVIPQPEDGSKEEIPSITKVLPPGFEARVGDRGCIVTGWAPQLQILAHSSTSGFMTHSGWNSSLESIIYGVPMISWPQSAEQHLNCRYLVDELQVAKQLPTGKENILKRNDVERAVQLLMEEPEGMAMRRRVQELQRKAAEATAEGGSKSRIEQEFLDEICGDSY